MVDLDYQVALVFKDSYRHYLVGEIGDVSTMNRADLLTWSLVLSELAADFGLLASAQPVGAI